MSIQSEITRISGNVSDAFTAITNKGVTVPAGSTSDDLADLISQISGGGGGGAISIVDTPDSAGGTVRTITAVDISSDTVTAAHLEQGYTAHDAEGNAITGTLSPGGGGLEYETGTYTPSADVAQPTINFSNSHTSLPFYALIFDITGTTQTTSDSNLMFEITTPNNLNNNFFRSSDSYGRTNYLFRGPGYVSGSGTNLTSQGTSGNGAIGTYLTATSFMPYTASNSRYWRSGSTYKWIAVWAPST